MKKKILFISSYSEVLKTFIPLIYHFKKYDIYVIAKYIHESDDFEKSKSLIEKNKLKGHLIENEIYTNRFNSNPLSNYLALLKIKRSAYSYFNKIKPDIIILGPDKNTFERFKKYNIDKNRLLLLGKAGTRKELLETYNKIDIALDPFHTLVESQRLKQFGWEFQCLQKKVAINLLHI